MSTVKILVVEDEMVIAENICLILGDLGYQVLEPAISFKESIDTIELEEPDLVLLDIQLAGKRDGVDLAEEINKRYQIPFIFLTSNSDSKTLQRVKNVKPSAFLVKPFKKEDIYISIELALHNYAEDIREEKIVNEELLIKDAIFVKEKNLFHKIKLEEISYLKSDHVYIQVYTVDAKKYIIRGSLTDLAERLPTNFYRSHRSFVINLNQMDAINTAYVIIKEEQIPIGKNYREDLLRRLRME